MATYTVSANLMLFPKPVSTLLPFLPQKRFLPLLAISRPMLPGQRFLSGATVAPQLGWRGMLAGYGLSQARDALSGVWQSPRDVTPDLPVTVEAGAEQRGVMNCSLPKSKLDWARQIGGTASKLAFSLLPF